MSKRKCVEESADALLAMAGNATPKYKLIYFNFRGMAEITRMMFKLSNVPFEDFRYHVCTQTMDRKEFENDKSKYPFLALPVLELEDGLMIPQSKAIERYVAKQLGYWGTNDVEAALIDSYCEFIIDIKQKFNAVKSAYGIKNVTHWVPITEQEKKKISDMAAAAAASYGKNSCSQKPCGGGDSTNIRGSMSSTTFF